MIVKVCESGRDMPGFAAYLFGPGRSNEHTNQHLVAGSSAVMAEWGASPSKEWILPVELRVGDGSVEDVEVGSDAQLSVGEARALGRQVESAWRAAHLQQMVGASSVRDPGSRGGVSTLDRHDSPMPEHVYHVVMSLRPDEGSYTDAQWATLADQFVRGMGFEADEVASSCRWFAMRHGVSVDGSDHLHIAVCAVRNDGVPASLRYVNPDTGKKISDFAMSQRLRRQLERDNDFVVPLSSIGLDAKGAGATSYTAAESRRANARQTADRAHPRPDREVLAEAVRGAATAATTEAHFVQNLRDAGLAVHPRWAPGGRESVVGYSVSLKDSGGANAKDTVRLSGSKLGPDLSLTKLRRQWAENETQPSRAAALKMWRGGELQRPSGRVATELAHAEAALGRWADTLEQTPPTGTQVKAETARAAGTVALIAHRAGKDPSLRPLSATAQRLTQALRTDLADDPGPLPRVASEDVALAARHLNLALRAGGMSSSSGWYAVFQQMQRAIRAIEKARNATDETRRLQRRVTAVDADDLTPVGAFVQDHAPTAEAAMAQSVLGHSRGRGTTPRPGTKDLAASDTGNSATREAKRQTDHDQGPGL